MNSIIGYFASFGFGGLVVYLILTNPDKSKRWAAIFCDLFSFIFKKLKYNATQYSIESKINDFVDRLSKSSDVEPTKVKIKWAGRNEEEKCYFEEDQVVLVMRDREYRNKNFVHAAYFFTSSTLLWRTKRHISQKQSQAIDIYTTKKIIENEDSSSLRIFMQEYFQPLLEDVQIRELVDKFIEIDQSGFYTNILITELTYLGQKTLMDARTQDIIIEVKNLIQFLYRFATREVGDESTLDIFIGKYCRCSIKIVSTAIVRYLDRAEGPTKRIKGAFSTGVENVYVIGPDADGGRKFISKVCQAVIDDNCDCVIVNKKKFPGSVIKNKKRSPTTTYFVHIHNHQAVKYIITKEMIEEIGDLKIDQ